MSSMVERLRENIETTHYRPDVDELLDAAADHITELEMRIAYALTYMQEHAWELSDMAQHLDLGDVLNGRPIAPARGNASIQENGD